jgi:hypothetical protein
MNKYPSSQVIKECFFDRSKVLNELQIAYFEDPGTISLDVAYASDALDACDVNIAYLMKSLLIFLPFLYSMMRCF